MNKERLYKYAELIVKVGVNVQNGQEVVVRCGLDQPEFVKIVVEELYKAGASKVKVEWSYMPITKLHYNYRSLETMSKVSEIEKAEWQEKVDILPCLLWLDSDDPDGLEGTDNEKISKANQNRYPIIKSYKDAIENKYQWCIAAVPGKEWAKKVFPALSDEEAVEELWIKILDASRVNEDPVDAWKKHNEQLSKRCKFLNDCNFDTLEYKSSNGTNFTVGLIEEGIFMGGGEYTLGSNIYFNPNIPTEEVFTTPKKGRAEGTVISTIPLSYQGKLIEDFGMEFKNGKVTKVFARTNQDLLEKMVSMDEGAAYLGEVALIGYDSPINNTGVLFYNTLFDENASCHLALGRGFSNCLKDYEKYSLEESQKLGINNSMIHVDFMIGSKDMEIVGVKKDGTRIQIFKNGNWVI